MTLEEKAARAMAISDGFDPEYKIEGSNRMPTEDPIWSHPMYMKYARAVVAALSNNEPPER